MSELVEKYFSQDLSLAEDEALEAALSSSHEAAERFSELALAAYASFGLPEASWKRRRAPFLSRLGWKLPLLLLTLGSALALSASWYGAGKSQAAGYREESISVTRDIAPAEDAKAQPALRQAVPLPQAPAPAKPATPEKTGSRLGSRLSLVVKQAQAGPALVEIRDSAGKRVLTLFDGLLSQGERRFEWDGRKPDGGLAEPGLYRMTVRRGEQLQSKDVMIHWAKKP